jgi:diguanylate cyclase (GGDEF)-like protein
VLPSSPGRFKASRFGEQTQEQWMIRAGRQWWQQPDHYNWISAYIKDRGLQTRWRIATFTVTAALTSLPLVMLASPAGPDNKLTVAVSFVAAAVGVACALLWLTRWPTRKQSALYSLVASGSIAATCLAQSDPYVGMNGCVTFAVIGGFIAYFHTANHMLANFALAAVCTGVMAYRVADETGDIAIVVGALLIGAALNIGVPFGIESLVHTLRGDVRSSGHDPLTGLLNRRSFYPSVYELVMGHLGERGAHLIVAVVDLDKFKQVNDTRGHAAGDQALVGVAAALLGNCSSTAVIGRVGGEEFAIADIDYQADPAMMAERLRRGIAVSPFEITASVGTASSPLSTAAANSKHHLIDSLILAADAAMYDAKRAGGNRVRHSET